MCLMCGARAGPWEYIIGATGGALFAHTIALHEEHVQNEINEELHRRESANSRLREAQRQHDLAKRTAHAHQQKE